MGVFSFTDYIIDSERLIENVRTIKRGLVSGVKFCAVVKADAYGVGSEIVSRLLNDCVDCYAVANLEEGMALRKAEIDKRILVLGPMNFDFLNVYFENFLSPTVSTVFEMSKLSRGLKSPLEVEFGLNSGMNRFGFSEKTEIVRAISTLKGNLKIKLFGAFSHLATKENDVAFMMRQRDCFEDLLLPFEGMDIVRHIANSNAALNHKDLQYDMVRVGFGLYGMDASNGLLPVVSIRSRIVLINEVAAGESVGYDRTFVAGKNMKVAVVPVGYFDGFERCLSNRGSVLVCGQRADIVGRVCMDVMMVDVSNVVGASVGSEVVLLGQQGDKELRLGDYARWCGTSEYEVLSRLNRSRMNIVIK